MHEGGAGVGAWGWVHKGGCMTVGVGFMQDGVSVMTTAIISGSDYCLSNNIVSAELMVSYLFICLNIVKSILCH